MIYGTLIMVVFFGWMQTLYRVKVKNELTAIWLNPHLPNFEKISGKIEVALEFKRSHESCDMMWVTSREILYEDFIFDADGPSEMEVSRPDCKILLFKFFLG